MSETNVDSHENNRNTTRFGRGNAGGPGRPKLTSEEKERRRALKEVRKMYRQPLEVQFKTLLTEIMPRLASIAVDPKTSPKDATAIATLMAEYAMEKPKTKTETTLTATVTQTITPEVLQSLSPEELEQALALDSKLYGAK